MISSKKFIAYFPLMAALLCGAALADIPQKLPLTRFSGLWNDSPFTSKPPPEEVAAQVNPLDDFTLTGIAPVPGGYRVTIINKKNPEQKEVIEPGGKSPYKIVSVNRNPDVSLGTTVVLAAGSVRGTVAFEQEMLTLKTAQGEPEPQQAPAVITPQTPANNTNDQQRQPRPRIMPPPPAPAQAPAPNP